MPERAKRLSRTPSGRRAQTSERGRPNAHQRGYDRRWRAARRRFLADWPYCRHCQARGLVIAATVVDHIRPHRGNKALFWQLSNWQPLCKRCHDRKTAEENRGE